MSNFQDSYLSGANIEFIEGLYARYLEDPNSVDPSWRELFAGNGHGRPIFVPAEKRPAPAGAVVTAPIVSTQAEQNMELQARVDQTVYAFRLRGHLLAQLDPLGRPRPSLDHVADVGMVNTAHFTKEELELTVDATQVFPENRVKLRDLLDRLRRTYCGSIGVEYMHVLDSDRRRWLGGRMEHSENRTEFTAEERKRLLTKLTYAEAFENFLHTKYVNVKRFALDGGESLVPMIDVLLDTGARLGVAEVVIAMAHRGRLNVLNNILLKSADEIFSEFEKKAKGEPNFRGDVKYHQGFSSDYPTASGKPVHLTLAFNPSHLEAVYPVVEGRVRAKQDRLRDVDRTHHLPLVMHGDASFMGQGVVAETLNLSRLRGYTTGGTVHIVINNQVGFTTDPQDARSSHYSTAIAQLIDVPIFHVNADDPEACAHVMRLATEYRQKFGSDVVVDLICYRRYGHNEGDEPAFTQPQMYELIRHHPPVRVLYSQELAKRGAVSQADADAIRQQAMKDFEEALSRARSSHKYQGPSFGQGVWKSYKGGPDRDTPQVETGLPEPRVRELLGKLARVPQGFTPHPRVTTTVLQRRENILAGKDKVDWSAAENLAYASLLEDGYSVRLTGQDVERGTFSHRHAVLHDVKSGERYEILQQFAKKDALCAVINSPLSEQGCLGFEYGYSLDSPDGLVVWEAQFGDFANGAQVIIDQFISAGEVKWRRLSGVTLLLPHGYEGMGPEHSSARLERFLGMCGEDNMQVAYPTTPAQIFHLLRRQVLRPLRKPLVIMSPKSLLRLAAGMSELSELTQGRFQRVLLDRPEAERKGVTKLLLCSGRVYFDLVAERDARKDWATMIVRLEQLYPFPKEELEELLKGLPKLAQLVWVQEEPWNMGAWRYMIPLLQDLVSPMTAKPAIEYVGRTASASPATGFDKVHEAEQQQIVEQALHRGVKNGR